MNARRRCRAAAPRPGQIDQVGPQHRPQLLAVAVGELPEQLAQRGRRVHAGEQPVHPAAADHVQILSEFAGIGAALELLGVSRYISIPIAALAIWALVLFGSYRYAERVFLILSLVFLAYPVAAILGHPTGRRSPRRPSCPISSGSAFLLLGVALIGTTITPYMQLYVAAAVADKGIGPEEYRYERIDSVGGAIFGDIISMFIIIATAAAIGAPAGRSPRPGMPPRRSSRWPVRFAVDLFAIGLFGASALAGAVVPLSTAYAISEAVGVERSVSRRFREAPIFLVAVHRPGGDRRRRGPRTRQPDRPPDQDPGAERAHHAGHPGLHPDPGQPPQPARRCRQRPHLPGRRHRVGGRRQHDVGLRRGADGADLGGRHLRRGTAWCRRPGRRPDMPTAAAGPAGRLATVHQVSLRGPGTGAAN